MKTASSTGEVRGFWLLTAAIVAVSACGIRVEARSAQAKKTAPDAVVPGVVLVKLNPDGARQFASGASVYDLFGPQSQSFGVHRADEAFPAHSIMRYAASNAQTMSVHGPALDDDISRILVVRYAANVTPRDAARSIASSPFVEYAEPQPVRYPCYVPNDSLLSQQWHHNKIQSFAAWDIEKGDSNVVVAVVDNGVDYTHPDLAPNLWTNKGEMGLDNQGRDKRSNGVDDDGDGYIDDWRGWDFAGATSGAAQDNDPSGGDHGIHVSGIAVGRGDNVTGIAGVAYNCKLMVVKVAYDDTPGSLNFGFEGITFAADHGARVINCSWGGSSSSTTEQLVINYATKKGALVVCAAGNSSSDAAFYPAWYNHVFSVTASTSNDQPDPFYANFGRRVDVMAPGSNIFSTYNAPTMYTSESGTSMASPCAAGVAALVASHFPELTPDQIAARVRVTSDPQDFRLYGKYQKQFGYGRVNAYRAVHDDNVEAVWVDSTFVTGDNNNDGLLEPGETGAIRVRFKNMLAPTTNLTATLVDSIWDDNNAVMVPSPYVHVLSATSYLGAMSTLTTGTTQPTEFVVQIDSATPQNLTVWFRVDFNDGAYNDYRYFQLLINPTFITLNANDIVCSINSRGNQAYNDFPTNNQGAGFTYKGSDNLLFEGALMIGTDASHLLNVARNDAQGGQDSDFTLAQRIEMLDPAPTANAQEAAGVFTDASASASRKLGVEVSQHHYAFTDSGNTNYVLLTYKIKNTSNAPLVNMYCGIYLDWDIGDAGDSNYVDFDDQTLTGWVRRVNSTYPVVGSALVSDQQTSFYAVDNNANPSNPPFLVNDGYTPAEKFISLSSGIGRRSSTIGDVGNTIGGGPITLGPGEDQTFAFVLSSGTTLADLQAATLAARAKWHAMGGSAVHQAIIFPTIYELTHKDTTLVGVAHNPGAQSVNALVQIAGPDAHDFSLLSPASGVVPLSVDGRADIAVRFSPDSAGNRTAMLIINYGAAIDTINLYGAALPSGLSVDPQVVFFDTTALTFSSQKTIAIGNNRPDAATMSWAISGPDAGAFSLTALSQPYFSVPPGGVTFPVTFTPNHTAGFNAVLTLSDSASGTAYTVSLVGTEHTASGVAEAAAPASPVIVTNYPDPFSTRTRIVVTGAQNVRDIAVYDMLGRVVADLTRQSHASSVVFDATRVPAGSYYARVTTTSGIVLRPLTVVK